MKILIIGCGIQSYGAALDIVRFAKPEKLVLADYQIEQAEKLKAYLNYPSIACSSLDARDIDAVAHLAKNFDLMINTSPYEYGLNITKAAIQAKTHLVDLGGDTEMVLNQLKIKEEAKAAGITVVPDCGMGPGITNIFVGHAMELVDYADDIRVRDGGIPQNSNLPLKYFLLFAIDTLINEYTGKTTAVRNEKIIELESLTEIEEVNVPGVGVMEATHGMGMLSTLPWTYQGKIKNMDNKFLRFPGHLAFMSGLKEAGFFSREKIQTEEGFITPRLLSKAVLQKALSYPYEKDMCIIQSIVRGKKDNQLVEIEHLLIDRYSEADQMTSMVRTTGFSASIVGQMILNGTISEKGVIPPEIAVPKVQFFDELKRRGMQLKWTQK